MFDSRNSCFAALSSILLYSWKCKASLGNCFNPSSEGGDRLRGSCRLRLGRRPPGLFPCSRYRAGAPDALHGIGILAHLIFIIPFTRRLAAEFGCLLAASLATHRAAGRGALTCRAAPPDPGSSLVGSISMACSKDAELFEVVPVRGTSPKRTFCVLIKSVGSVSSFFREAGAVLSKPIHKSTRAGSVGFPSGEEELFG